MENLFVIERDRDFADCLRKIFESEGFNVICVDSASAAIDRFGEISPMLVVIDLHDGEDVTLDDVDALTNHPSEIPVLVTAHYGNPEIACKALSIGADDYILKPFGTQEILEHIRRLAHGNGNGESSDAIEGISDSICRLGNPDDIFRTSLNQLSEILCLGDCLIAIRDGDSFRIMASRNYRPDPVGRLIRLSRGTMEILEAEGRNDNETDTTGVREIVNSLGLMSHRPFPILMPLSDGVS
ncbi:MAG: response regulator, partial [bacterium]